MAKRQDEVWKMRLGHKNFQKSEVDEGGDLSLLLQKDLVLESAVEFKLPVSHETLMSNS
jgi:hypothetical protein